MKLRLEENSLRLRVSEAEVQEFAHSGRVAYTIVFGPGADQTLHYSLEKLPATASAEAVQVRYAAGALAVEVPAALAQEWTNTEKNGFSAQIVVAEGRELRILVEKDLDCRH
ncbi:hypothetical protein [Hymenobacter sp. BT559]|jgi:hypothetical protein|uniref:DUF7009 family protein n=1 Tax=Hymenobacter sp. BT559 TaxID=2795729 RepID=UPI0018EA6C52|nr:hypothetical protein [Hymenobacter sp. BT559]MBJ6144996.1 hypothetical protein [Hymenobacter sp. BT559]